MFATNEHEHGEQIMVQPVKVHTLSTNEAPPRPCIHSDSVQKEIMMDFLQAIKVGGVPALHVIGP